MRPARAALRFAAPLAALALGACAGLGGLAEPGTYALDPTHTSVAFDVAHFGTSTSRGRFERAEGEVQIDDAGRAQLEVHVATAAVSTGVPALDGRLRGPDFLDSAAFPTATFAAEHVVVSAGQVGEVAGTLTLRGTSLPLTLTASHFNCYISPLLARRVCGGDFEATLQPSRWGVTGHLAIGLADEARLRVQVEAIRQ